MIFRSLALSVLLLSSGPADAERARELADSATRDLAVAVDALAVAETADERVAALTTAIRAYETGLAALRDAHRQAELEVREVEDRLTLQDADLGRLLSLLQKISRSSPGSPMSHPGSAAESLRAGILASALVPSLQSRSAEISEDLGDLRALRDIQGASLDRLRIGLVDLNAAREDLFSQVGRRTPVETTNGTDDAILQALLETSDTLAAFADSFSVNQSESIIDQEPWSRPVIGEIIREFDGDVSSGWTVETAPGALVVAPAAATIRFAGETDSLGNLTILETEPGVLLILQGHHTSFVQTDMVVSEGDPVAIMGGQNPLEQENLNETTILGGQSDGETLYIEIRQGRKAVDPSTRFGPT